MDIKKWVIGGITGGILYFLLGWLIYGMLLLDFMKSHPGTAGNIARETPEYLYLVIGNLAMGFLVAYVFMKGNIGSMSAGVVAGGILGLLSTVGIDCIIYATTTIESKTAMAVDVAASTVMSAVVGGIMAAVMGKRAA